MRHFILTCIFLVVASLLNENICLGKEPSSPILILADHSNFGTYTGEILKAEGFCEFKIESPGDANIDINHLNQFDLVILGETSLSEAQKEMFFQFVHRGGHLIAFRPDKGLASLFGLQDTGGTLKEGYLKIDTKADIGKGLVSQTIQYHSASDLYKLDGGAKIAGLYSDSQKDMMFPAVVIHDFGKGRAAAFTYNLPKSIVYTREGNPEWAGEERDKVDGPTATDLFYPHKGETQWNDPLKIAVPQADEQMHLLSHLIENLNSDKKPLPRLWYFPDQYKCIFIFTIDGEDSKEGDIDNEILDVQKKGGNATLYEIGTYISPSTVNKWRSNGNEVAVHYNDVPNYSNPTYSNMKTVIDTMNRNFQRTYGYLPKTTRNHWVVWNSKDSLGRKEFAEQAVLEANYGIGFDCNYYQFGGNKVYPNWMGDVGHFTGSGIPMKFADTRGNILPIYQSNTQLPDETWLKENIESKSKTLIDRSLDEENYAWVNANYHTWYWPETRTAGLRVLDYCNRRGVPIWTAEKAYDFLKMKDEASFSDFEWINNRLSFTLNSSLKHSAGFTVLIPETHTHGKNKIKRITRDQNDQTFVVKSIKGNNYALVTVEPGHTYHFSVEYSK